MRSGKGARSRFLYSGEFGTIRSRCHCSFPALASDGFQNHEWSRISEKCRNSSEMLYYSAPLVDAVSRPSFTLTQPTTSDEIHYDERLPLRPGRDPLLCGFFLAM